jgi:porin
MFGYFKAVRVGAVLALLFLGAAILVSPVLAQEQRRTDQAASAIEQGADELSPITEVEQPSEILYSGDLQTRSTITGDWGGARSDLAARGVTVDLSMTQIWQGVATGGKDNDWETGGRANLTLNVDTQKLGLWPGGFLTVELEGNFGDSVNTQTGALLPVNSNQLYPFPPTDNFAVPNLSFTQFFSEYAGIYAGKIDLTLGGDANEFAHGKGDNQFFNLALNFIPLPGLVAPSSTLGAGVILLPTKNPEAAIVNLSVLQTNGKAITSGFENLSAEKLTFAGEGRVRTNFFGKTGHQLFGAMYSNAEFAALNQNFFIIIQPTAIKEKTGSWGIYYNFDQYLYEPRKGQGVGIFGRFGASDGDPNLIHYFYSIGIGAKGLIEGRPLDECGIGYYYMDITDPTLQGPFETFSFLRDEQGFEAYYKFAITPWIQLTPDIQVVKPAQKNMFTINTDGLPVIEKEGIDTAVVFGLRLKIIF